MDTTTGEWPTQSFITCIHRTKRRKKKRTQVTGYNAHSVFILNVGVLIMISVLFHYSSVLSSGTTTNTKTTDSYAIVRCWVNNIRTATTTPKNANININQRKEHDKGVRKRACFLNVRIIIIRSLAVIIIISTLSVSSAIITRLRNFRVGISEWME